MNFLNKTICELLGVPPERAFTPDTKGIEIEMEGEGIFPSCPSGWKYVPDGSLRGVSTEAVLTKPLPTAKCKESIKNLEDTLSKHFTIVESSRAGIHIHLNMLGKSFKEVLKFSILYYLLEPVIIRACGPNRINNHFCSPLYQSQEMVNILGYVVGEESIYSLENDSIRYAAMNFKPLAKYGTLEFRGLGTETSFDNIILFLDMFDNILKAAENYSTCVDIFSEYHLKDYSDFVKEIIGDKFLQHISEKVSRMAEENSELCIDLATITGIE